MSQLSKNLCALGAGLLALSSLTSPASAEQSPYYYGASLGLNHVSNIYRVNSNPNSDNVATIALLGGIDQHLGRQRLFADASVQTNRYRSNTDLNNISYNLRGGLDWSTIGNLSGTISASGSQALANYNVASSNIVPVFAKNIETNRQINSTTRLGLVTKLTLEGTVGADQRRFSLLAYSPLEFDQWHYSLGLFYQSSADLRLGVSARRTNTNYPGLIQLTPLPNLTFAPAKYERNDIDLTADWTVSGKSKLYARLSSGHQTRTLGPDDRFSGWTGQLTWNWQPTARWYITTSISRDTGIESSLFQSGPLNTAYDQNRLTTAGQLNVNYELSSKLTLTGSASLSNANRQQSLENTDLNALGYDKDKAFSLGINWAYSRSISLGCQIGHNSRDSSTPIYVYTANSFGCTGQILVR